MGFLAKLFGTRRSEPVADAGIHKQVRCAHCGALIKARIDGRNDLSLNDQSDGYFVRKVLVDDRCFRRIQLEMTFDLQRREIGCTVEGGQLVAV